MIINILPKPVFDLEREIRIAKLSRSSNNEEVLYQIAKRSPKTKFKRGEETFSSDMIIAAYEEHMTFT